VAYDPAAIKEKYGLTPPQLIDLKALQGDASDNIPGVPGVGEKTALDLMSRFGSLEALYDSLDTADMRDSLRGKLAAGKDSAYLSRTLGTICRTAPIDTTLAHYEIGEMQREELAALLQDLELYKWMEKLGLTAVPVPTAAVAPVACAPVCGNEGVEAILAAARRSGKLDVLAQTEGGELTALALAAEGTLARVDRFCPQFEELTALLTDPAVEKRTHDSKPLFGALLGAGRRPAGFSLDTALAAYLLNPLATD
jgi:DNA polymerase-1